MANVVQMVLYMGAQALLAPVVLQRAGAATLGAFGAIMQVVAYGSLFDLAVSITLARFLARTGAGPDAAARFKDTFTTGRTCILLCGVALALTMAASVSLILRLLRLPETMLFEARTSMYLIAVWFVARVPLASYDDALIATQNLARAHLITGVQQVARVLASLCAVLAGAGLLGMIAAAVAADLAAGYLYRVSFFRLYPRLRPGWGLPDRELLGTMLRFAFHVSIAQFATMLTFASGNLIAGYLFGAVGVAIIYTNQLPAQTAYTLVLRLPDNAAPALNDLHSRAEYVSLRSAFLRLQRLTLSLAIPLAIGIATFNQSFIALWVGPSQSAGALMSTALAGLTATVAMEHVVIVFAMACGLERAVARLALAEAVVTVVLSLAAGRYFGPAGLPGAVAIAILPKTIYLWRRLPAASGVTARVFLQTCCAPSITASGCALLAALASARAVPLSSWTGLMIAGGVFGSVYGAVFYLCCATEEERATVRRATAPLRTRFGARSAPARGAEAGG